MRSFQQILAFLVLGIFSLAGCFPAPSAALPSATIEAQKATTATAVDASVIEIPPTPALASPTAPDPTAAPTQGPEPVPTATQVPDLPLVPTTVNIQPPDPCQITSPDMLGPYYLEGAPMQPRPETAGEFGVPLVITGTVWNNDCTRTLPGVVLDLWQADENGDYDFSEQFLLRWKIESSESGAFQIETILPGAYAVSSSSSRPGHIHLMVSAPGMEPLVTQLYFSGDPFLAEEPGIDSARVIPLTQKDTNGWEGLFHFVLPIP